ncbi:MAG TPA: hypothetical protein VF173_01435 [Thermoanaerobaculia bacterium]|nr:hypothetical protein [Thermoanaerobaculia bacterium]
MALFKKSAKSVLFNLEGALEPATLTIAQLALSIVSGVTTYRGFLLVLNQEWMAVLAAIGVQTLVFWIPRRLRQHHAPIRALGNISLFLLGMAISVTFSYQAFFDILIPENLREAKTTSKAFADARDFMLKSRSAINAALSEANTQLSNTTNLADLEDKQGVTSNGKPGQGSAYRSLRVDEERIKADAQGLTALQTKAESFFAEMEHLEASAGNARDKRASVKSLVDNMASVVRNPLINDYIDGVILPQEPPEIEIDAHLQDQSLAAKNHFMQGIALAQLVFDADYQADKLGEGIGKFRAGAAMALFLAVVIDLLIFILGFAGATKGVPYDMEECVEVLATSEDGKQSKLISSLGRLDRKLSLRVLRNKNGEATDLSPRQELAMQMLINAHYLHLQKEEKRDKEGNWTERLVLDEKIVPIAKEAMDGVNAAAVPGNVLDVSGTTRPRSPKALSDRAGTRTPRSKTAA